MGLRPARLGQVQVRPDGFGTCRNGVAA